MSEAPHRWTKLREQLDACEERLRNDLPRLTQEQLLEVQTRLGQMRKRVLRASIKLTLDEMKEGSPHG